MPQPPQMPGGGQNQWIGPVIAGGASLLGGELGAKRARDEAKKNREFQERMRNTAWQAAVSDMQAAGINPALAYSKGPAAAPSGGQAQQKDTLTPAISSALQAKRLQADLENIRLQNLKVAQDTATSTASEGFIKEQTELVYQQMRMARLTMRAYEGVPTFGRRGVFTTMETNELSPDLIRRKLEAEIRAMGARSGQQETLTRIGTPLAKAMDDYGVLGLLIAGAARYLGPGFAKRVQIPNFKGRKLQSLPKFRIPTRWGGGR